jgi:hypothetical protein
MAVRTDETGTLMLAVYFRSTITTRDLSRQLVHDTVAACGFEESTGEDLSTDLERVFGPGTVGVVGIDPGAEGTVSAMKLNPANVPLERAYAHLRSRGVPVSALHRISTLALALRARVLSYLGLSFGPAGFAGWRAYFSLQPGAMPRPTVPRLALEPVAIPSLHCPHY